MVYGFELVDSKQRAGMAGRPQARDVKPEQSLPEDYVWSKRMRPFSSVWVKIPKTQR